MSYKQGRKCHKNSRYYSWKSSHSHCLFFFFWSPKYLMPFTETNTEKLYSSEFPWIWSLMGIQLQSQSKYIWQWGFFKLIQVGLILSWFSSSRTRLWHKELSASRIFGTWSQKTLERVGRGKQDKQRDREHPGWLSRLSIWLLILAQVTISESWDQALSQAPHCGSCSRFSPSLSCCPSPPTQREKKNRSW